MAMLDEKGVSALLDDRRLLIDRLLAVQHPKDVDHHKHGPLVHALIESQARRTPEAIAVQFENEAFITYRKLNETANAVARQLVCGRGTMIPIAVSRSPCLVIALLAVLKTGAAYLPLSPETPSDRVRFMLEDTRAPFLVVDSTTQDLVPGIDKVSIDELVSKSWTASAAARKDLNVYQTPADTAYVIYTSGTTGRPKGVVLSHAAVATGLASLPRPRPNESLRQLLCHAPNFSAAQRTVLGTLSRGGTLCLASKESITLDLAHTLRKMDVASLEITPSMLKLLSPEELPDTVKRIVLGGEAIGPAIVEAWADKVELISAYGLSECTQLNMRHQILPGQRPNFLGKPLDSTICYVLAPGSLSPVPANVPGELCLGGSQLAERYLNLPDKTREVFVPNPFGHGRLYRTGDMVAIRDDGSLELLGRIDQQVKIDGQRVEPSESNAAIQLLPGVAQSFVVSAVVLDRPALAAFIVPDDSKPWTILVRDIRSALKEQIPSYAIPKYWLEAEELPLNTSGKVDVSRLVATVQAKTPAEMTPSSAQPWALNTLEQTLAEAMAGVLPLAAAEVDVGMSFQELGGTSLDAILLASKLRHAGIHVSVPDILQAPSLRELASTRFTFSFERQDKTPQPFALLPQGVSMPSFEGLVDAYPATPLQEGILADSMLQNANYVYQRVYRIRGVDSSVVRSALRTVVQQNPIFRTSFVPWKRGFLQLVRATADLPFTQLQGVALNRAMRESASQEMPLDGPLVRATICDGEHLILDMHHALFDYWSRQFLVADAAALLRKEERPAPRLPFSTYVAYQQQHMQKPETMAFWRDYLHAAPGAVLDIPTASDRGAPLALTAKLGDGLAHLSHVAGVTVGTAVHAAWVLTLAGELNSDDVAFVTEFSGRDADIDGVLDLAGPTLCTAPIRVRVDKAQTALQFTSSVQTNLWSLSKDAHAGLRNALAAASIKPAAVNTMVNVLVQLEDVPEDGPLAPVVTHANNFTQYITIEVSETDPTVARLLIPYSADEARASRILDAFARSVKWLSTHPQQPLHDLFRTDSPMPASPVSSSTSSFLTVHPTFGLAHAPFESCAASTPDKTAILTTAGGSLTYAQLDGRANALAAHLLAQGVRHGEMIPLYMEKSPATLIAVLAILKAGAAFAPLDPRNPADRNRFIAGDVAAKRVVTDAAHRDACGEVFAGLPLVVPEEMALDERAARIEPGEELTPDSSAYAIYTSGSTGVPKGVLVPHSAVAAATLGMIEATGVTREWRALWVLNYVFDASYYDVFTLLSAGATICLGPQDDLLGDLAGVVNRLGVEQVMLTPTITKLIRGGPKEVPRLKVLNVCGEKIDVNILEWAKSVEVYNGYGPTEATILMTVSKVEPDGDLNSIGRGLKYVEAVIVEPDNNSLKRVGPSQVGELCVRGPQLAKGYINRPEQTSAVFMSDVDGERLYRTGDLARWADDGSLICLGRKDYQVKLNGFRIELGEIENAILLTGLVEAAVVSVAEIGGKRQLVSFCIFNGDGKPSEPVPMPAALRLDSVAELKGKLTTISHYMMPSLFLPFHAFPTLASGKANRKELVALVESLDESVLAQYRSQEEEEEFKAVESEEERVMQEAWAAVLDRPAESIGAHSVFATLGGDSVSAINVVAECRRLSYTISVAHVLAEPTLAGQAKKLKRAERKSTKQLAQITIPQTVTVAIADAGIDVEDVFPCGPGQTEFLIQGNTEHQFWNLTACRELPPDFDLAQWKTLTEALTARNQILRACYIQADRNVPSSWYQVTLKDSTLDWEELTYETDEEKVQLMEQLRDSTFTFGKPHVKYRLLRNTRRDSAVSRTLCIKINHGSYDGTLLRIFDSHLAALSRGEEPAVHSFKTYIDWVSTATEERRADLSYWQRTLSTYAPSTANHSRALSLTHPVSDRLKLAPLAAGSSADATAAQFGVTPATLFLAAYLVAARGITGSTDVLLDNLITGRNAPVARPDALAGTCATFLPLRWAFASDARTRITQFLADVQAAFWETTEHGAVGLQDIYEALARDRHGPAAAKLLFCFQPFDPPAPGAKQSPRWLVMAQSKAYMTINYALMVEVQKTAQGGYRLKLQWDSRALDEREVDGLVGVFERVLGVMGEKGGEGVVQDLL